MFHYNAMKLNENIYLKVLWKLLNSMQIKSINIIPTEI